MKRSAIAIALGFGFALAAAPADAQLVNFPTIGLPTGAPSTFVAAQFGRGLNDTSGKTNAFGAFIGRTGIADRVTVAAGVGMINYDPDAKYTFGGTAAIAVTAPEAATAISVQAGLGYLSLATDFSTMNIPIGVAVRRTIASDSGNLGIWAMPRLNMTRVTVLGTTGSSTDFGVSGGAAFTTSGGFGFHAALDMLATDPSAVVGGVGVHLMIG